ncbi:MULTISPECIES: hypothetical protein [Vibrio]|uniref:hypothetical protein n=1 Tax=Vibrio TaxID=662 RepID=UPI00051946C7|nr:MULTISPECIES: hypothetical protein [Vibrio]HDY7429464.1 hypothetical protein [Vibrio vulnificus]HDY7951973.1 hypothetical protein [Vibrio vulnificus]HDZ5419768.1 hypothetical protein [Vibrio harveyi]
MICNNINLLALMSLLCVSVVIHAETQYSWHYRDGDVVPQQIREKLAEKCKSDEAIYKLANANENGDFDEAFEEFKLSIECISSHGIDFPSLKGNSNTVNNFSKSE